MLRRRKFIFATLAACCIFLLMVTYLMNILIKEQNEEILTNSIVEEKIKEYLLRLPEKYKIKNNFLSNISNLNIETVHAISTDEDILNKLWYEVNFWVTKGIFVNVTSNLGSILTALKYAKIIYADLDTRGTQLKLLLTLQVRNIDFIIISEIIVLLWLSIGKSTGRI